MPNPDVIMTGDMRQAAGKIAVVDMSVMFTSAAKDGVRVRDVRRCVRDARRDPARERYDDVIDVTSSAAVNRKTCARTSAKTA